MTGDEMEAAAEYYAAVAWRPHVRVVETKLVPGDDSPPQLPAGHRLVYPLELE